MNQKPMKRGQRITAFLLAFFLTLGSGLHTAKAQNLNQPVYAYGESLSTDQKQKTSQLLGVKDGSLDMQVNIKELNGLLHDTYNYYQCYSSVYLSPLSDNTGIKVEIVTPDTITAITPRQYENAALTAGATNMDIKVASVKAVDGSGALAGVYKAFSGTTGALPEENVKVAQKELKVTSAITAENKNKEGYSDDLLNAAVAEIKATITKEKEAKGGDITQVNIGQIINNVVNNYNLSGILSEENKKSLQDLMQQFSQLKLTEDQKSSLRKFGENVLQQGGKLLDSVKASWDNMDDSTKKGIGGFFQGIFQAIINFFQGILNAFH